MKSINQYIVERGPVKVTTGAGCVEMIRTIIRELSKNPDYKGKDKELWKSAGQFLYDYLRELNNSDYKKIVSELELPDLRNNKDEEFSPETVQFAMVLKMKDGKIQESWEYNSSLLSPETDVEFNVPKNAKWLLINTETEMISAVTEKDVDSFKDDFDDNEIGPALKKLKIGESYDADGGINIYVRIKK